MKIAVDTNILMRLVTGDIEKLAKRAQELVNGYGEDDIFVSYGVIMELYFGLKHHYGFLEEVALDAVEDILKIRQFNIEHRMAVQLAVNKSRGEKSFCFYDALIGEIGAAKNVKTQTFDKKLKKNASFVVI